LRGRGRKKNEDSEKKKWDLVRKREMHIIR